MNLANLNNSAPACVSSRISRNIPAQQDRELRFLSTGSKLGRPNSKAAYSMPYF